MNFQNIDPPFEVPWPSGELLIVTKKTSWYAEMWDKDRKVGTLQQGNAVIYLGESRISKRRCRTMIKVLAPTCVCWIDPRLFVVGDDV